MLVKDHPVKSTLLFFMLAALFASAQTNPIATTSSSATASNLPTATLQTQTQTNESLAAAQRVEEIRAACIQQRRLICGKILKVLPDGLVVDSGYSSLMRAPLNGSWLVPGTAVATRDQNVVESNQPDSICIGLVFLTDLPKTKGAKPKVYDYVAIEGFPAGQYIYTSVGDVRRTVRKFTCKLTSAVKWKFEESEQHTPSK